ncbi:MAG: DUF5112 domain-containing protein, partial [Paraprevotella sp.]|nr:DUF5112 domain-containing protein [Paraprevotella sp.]
MDSLNTLAYLTRYVCTDSSLHYAQQAFRIARNYSDGQSEALNNQMVGHFLEVDFEGMVRIYEQIQQISDNQIELLLSNINMMMVCQRTSQNRLFFDYYNRAVERIHRIQEERNEVKGRSQERLYYALTNFHLFNATNYLTLLQENEAKAELAAIDTANYLCRDEQLQSYFYFLNGVVRLNSLDHSSQKTIDAFDYFQQAYSLARRDRGVYFSSMIEEALSALFLDPETYGLIDKQRHSQLVDLQRLFLPANSVWQGEPVHLRLSEAMARKSLTESKECNYLMLVINGYLALGDVMFTQGEYRLALNYFETALSCLNRHHQIYYPSPKGESLKSYAAPDEVSVDMQWAKDPYIQTLPGCLANIRERLSLAYSALDEKQKSDYNRNLYLDLMDFTRQNELLESMANIVAEGNKMLNTLLTVIILLAAVFAILLFVYSRKWRNRSDKQYILLKDMSVWFMKVTFANDKDHWDGTFEAYPWMKKENRILREILRPYIEWMEKNRELSDRMGEERIQLQEAYLQSERHINRDKKKNISKRAKVSLVHSITPFIDRILYAVRRMEKQGEYAPQALEYVKELADEINHYNDVLTEWISLNRGNMELTIESFPLQELFDLLDKNRYGFLRKNIDFRVEPTSTWVKADRALTFFMINTLADNARKFTPEGGRVTLDATGLEDAVEISVTDTGCGLSSNEIDLITSSKIYDACKIGRSHTSSFKEKGSGFGLLNCKGIIEKYRKSGELFQVCRFQIDSKEGKGSRFSFRLPKGISRAIFLIFMTSVFMAVSRPIHAGHKTSAYIIPENRDSHNDELKNAVLYSDSVYFSNIEGRYEDGMRFADSTLKYINLCYGSQIPAKCSQRRLDLYGRSPEELDWLSMGVKADYFLIMSLRNEIAVAALALHEWSIYEYNNRQFSRRDKLLTEDESIYRFYAKQ